MSPSETLPPLSKGFVHRLKTVLARTGRRRVLGLATVLLAIAAFWWWADKPGLRARYVSHLDERPILVRTDDWLSIDQNFASAVFYYRRIFRVEWRGWVKIERGGEHRFRITSTGPARLAIDGDDVVVGGLERRRKTGRRRLEPGVHRIEIEFDHVGREILFDVEHRGPRGEWGAIPAHRLFDRRPGWAGRWLRETTAGLSSVERKLAASVLLVLALLAATRATTGLEGWRAADRLLAWAREPRRRRWLAGAGLGLLFVVAAATVLPRTGSPFGWDDVRYLDIAAFNKNVTWVLNRYAHVYLLDLFIWLTRGDAFLGARVFWSAQFGVIVCSLAVCAAQLGPRLQLATFWVSLLLLFSQPLYFLRAGASVPDTTVGTLVLAAVALYLHRWRRGPPAVEWQILTIGAITVWAVKSKELGVILLWLVVLFLFESGQLDWRGFVRKMTAWVIGVAAGLALLMIFDGYYFGDPLYGLRPSNQRAVSDFNLAPDPQQDRQVEGWVDVVSRGRTPAATDNPGMRYMALLVVASALLAGWRRRSIELRLLHLLPVLYVMMLMVIHVRATYVFLARYLYPVVPLSCFLVAASFHYLGLDRLSRREVRSPRFFVPAVLLAFLVFAVVVPYRGQWIEAGEFLPARWLGSIDWHSLDAFVRLVAAPVLVLTLVLALAVFQRHRSTRLLLTATLVALVLGMPFSRTLWELRTRRAWQRGETHLHGLRVLGHEVPQKPGAWLEIYLSPTDRQRTFGPRATCERIAKVYLRRRDLRVTCWPALLPEQDAAFLSLKDYRGWLESWPELERTAVFSPAGELVLVRPSDAGAPGRTIRDD